MWIRHILMILIGISAGFLVAGGLFTVLFTVGLIPRFAGKTRTGSHVKIYETAVILGSIFWNLVSIYDISLSLGWLLLGLYGFFSGIFVGCLALAIAEMLNGLPIFARRINFRRGLGIAILFLAIGKGIGNLIYFYKPH
ncbi:MAG: stage V sporulation protein AB [Lachnospiraceae bacterium]|nr:stage V sporulation protein AB [Lachnospiraceae bacterium]